MRFMLGQQGCQLLLRIIAKFARLPFERIKVCRNQRGYCLDMLFARLAILIEPVEAVGLNGDMLEAQAFAYLAVRVARGFPTSCPATTGVGAAVGGGQISLPS